MRKSVVHTQGKARHLQSLLKIAWGRSLDCRLRDRERVHLLWERCDIWYQKLTSRTKYKYLNDASASAFKTQLQQRVDAVHQIPRGVLYESFVPSLVSRAFADLGGQPRTSTHRQALMAPSDGGRARSHAPQHDPTRIAYRESLIGPYLPSLLPASASCVACAE